MRLRRTRLRLCRVYGGRDTPQGAELAAHSLLSAKRCDRSACAVQGVPSLAALGEGTFLDSNLVCSKELTTKVPQILQRKRRLM